MSDELVEVWKAEFDELAMKNGSEWKLYEGNAAWQGFLMAKRSQPVIELPKPNTCYDQVVDYYSKVTDSITAAGYQYKVKE